MKMIRKMYVVVNICCFCILFVVGTTGCSKKEDLVFEQIDEEAPPKKEQEAVIAESRRIFVQICGAVEKPGVYEVITSARIFEVVALAGGFTVEAAGNTINQALAVEDGQMIYVPTLEEAETKPSVLEELLEESDGLVDLNHANKQELMTIPGIGEAKAQVIINYREENGPFSRVEDLMKIEGIKEGIFNKMKNSITVK